MTMLRLNLFLALIAILCAIGVVAAQHQSRKLYTAYDQEIALKQQLDTEWSLLQLEQSTWAAHGRVEQLARQQLHMRNPAGNVVALEAGGKR